MAKYPYGKFIKKGFNDVMLGVKNEECEYALLGKAEFDLFSRNSYVNAGCGFSQIGNVVLPADSSFGIALDAGKKCTSLLHHVFEYYMLELEEQGVLIDIHEKYLRLVGDQICNNVLDGNNVGDTELDPSLNFRQAGGIFIFHYVLSFVAIGIAYVGPYFKYQLLPGKDPSVKITEVADVSSDELNSNESMS